MGTAAEAETQLNSDLPDGWTQRALGTTCDINPPRPRADALTSKTAVSFVPMQAIDASRGVIDGATERMFGDVRSGYTAFSDNDVLLAKITPCFENGKAAVARGLKNGLGFGSSEFFVIRSRGAILPEYIFHFVRQQSVRDRGAEDMNGAVGQARVPAEFLRTLELPIPPIAEQHRIVQHVEILLEQASRTKKKLERVLAILRRFRQSILAAACSGELTRDWRGESPNLTTTDDESDLPSSWRWCEMSSLATNESSSICAGPFGTIFKAHDFRDEGIPIIFLRHVGPGEYKTSKPGFMDRAVWQKMFRSYSVWGGELLITKLGDPPGVCAIYPRGIGPAMVTPDVIKMTTDENRADPRYLMYYLNSEPARQRAFGIAYGATRPRMNLNIFRALQVPLPPRLEQIEIVRRTEQLLAVAESIERRTSIATARMAKIPESILSKAFSGELVPTEAEVASREGRTFETASEMLSRVLKETSPDQSEVAPKRRLFSRRGM